MKTEVKRDVVFVRPSQVEGRIVIVGDAQVVVIPDETLAQADYSAIEDGIMAKAQAIGEELSRAWDEAFIAAAFGRPFVYDESHHIKDPHPLELGHVTELEARKEAMPARRAGVWKQEQARAPKPRDLYRGRRR